MIHLDKINEVVVNEFNPDAANKFRKEVLEISVKSPEMPIIIIINSPGGHVSSLIQMIETIDEVPNRFVTVCMGVAASCGAVLLAYGDARFITKHSDAMIHRVSAATWGDVKTMVGDVRHFEKLNNRILGILADRCKKTPQEIEDLIKQADNQEIWLNAEDALKFGLVDYIGTPDLKPDVAWCLTQSKKKEKAEVYHPEDEKKEQETTTDAKQYLDKVAKVVSGIDKALKKKQSTKKKATPIKKTLPAKKKK